MTWPHNCIRAREPLVNHTSFRIGGPAEWFAEPATVDELVTVLRDADGIGLPVSVVSGGTNTLAADLQEAIFQHQDARRRVGLYRDTLIPKSTESLQASLTGFEHGTADFLDLIDTELKRLRPDHDRRVKEQVERQKHANGYQPSQRVQSPDQEMVSGGEGIGTGILIDHGPCVLSESSAGCRIATGCSAEGSAATCQACAGRL